MVCPLCQHRNEAQSPVDQKGDFAFLQCTQCNLVYSDPMPKPDGEWYGQQAQYIVRDDVRTDRLEWNHQTFLNEKQSFGKRLLDVGCGTGRFLAEAKAEGYEVAGFDFDVKAVEKAKSDFGLDTVFAGELSALPEQESFDVVTAFEVLEHHPEPAQFLKEMIRVLKPGGYLAISVPNRDRKPAFRYDWDYPPNHVTRWNQDCLSSTLVNLGLEVCHTKTGWAQGEPFLHQNLQFGLITSVLKPKNTGGATSEGQVATAGKLYRIKEGVVRALSWPTNGVLNLMGQTGMGLYILARKQVSS